MSRWICAVAIAALFAGAPKPAHAAAQGAPKIHVVYSGQRLGSIAKRYNVSVEAICYANAIPKCALIKPGQRLVIPSRDDKDGSIARAQQVAAGKVKDNGTVQASLRTGSKKSGGPRWQDYARRPPRKSFVQLMSHTKKWRGLALDAKGRVRSAARQGIAALLGATGDHPGAPDRLLRLIVQVSDTFGGRPLHIVSGYRTTSHYADSRHKTSQAIDFSVVGVPNSAVRDYLRTLSSVGVGYYPNSTFLHLDVRGRTTYWVDYAGPGEAPRKTPRGTVVATATDVDDFAEERAEAAPSTEPSPPPEGESVTPDGAATRP